ncbi:MAG: glycosyltransferase family 2 protein [Thermoleophilaceae bacterium]
MTPVSVVVPTRNRARRLEALLASLADQDGADAEVVVVDNASEDDTPAVVAAARARAIRLAAPMGPAVARNAGWRAARGDLVVFTDDDCVAQPGWIAALAAVHARDAEAVIQGRTVPDPREAARLGAFARSQAVTGPGPWFQTCNIAYPRALLERLGGFDESFTDAAGEDTDLGWRAIEAGARVIFEPAALNWHAVHEPGALALVRATQKWRMGVVNVARHPQLRDALHRRVFWKPSHERLLVAAAGAILARRAPALALAALVPYVALHRSEHGSLAGTAAALPAHVAVDAAEVVAMIRGSAAAGTLVL